LYFFVGGAAGAAAIIGGIAEWTRTDGTLARDAKWIAAAGGPLSAALLTADLGRPERFINMLRVFKPQSAMSVGSWTLTAFSATSTAALAPAIGNLPALRAVGTLACASSAALGAGMLTYTGVLIGATAIPVWHHNVRLLPIHFAASGVASAVAILTLMGHDEPALNDLAVGAAAIETLIGAAIETRDEPALAPRRDVVRSGSAAAARRHAPTIVARRRERRRVGRIAPDADWMDRRRPGISAAQGLSDGSDLPVSSDRGRGDSACRRSGLSTSPRRLRERDQQDRISVARLRRADARVPAASEIEHSC
jgi:hypothetical protein